MTTMITLSEYSSDPEYPTPEVLSAALMISVDTAAGELTLVLQNHTASPHEFLINGVWFNATDGVEGLTLLSATHSGGGIVTGSWDPVQTDVHRAYFGTFDFGMTGSPLGRNPYPIGPGESVTFVLEIAGTGYFSTADFGVPNEKMMTALVKFMRGPEDASAFGATMRQPKLVVMPEPGTALLFGSGLLGLAGAGRHPRPA